MLHIRKRIKNIFRSHPVERSHGESIISSLPDSKLFGKVIEGIEGVAGVELLIVFSVAAFYLAVVARCEGFDFLVPDTEFSQCFLKECQGFVLTVSHFICKFKPIISLDTACLNRMSCVILFIADRVAPAFRFCLDNSTLAHASPIRYSFFLSVTHHCNTYKLEKLKPL